MTSMDFYPRVLPKSIYQIRFLGKTRLSGSTFCASAVIARPVPIVFRFVTQFSKPIPEDSRCIV